MGTRWWWAGVCSGGMVVAAVAGGLAGLGVLPAVTENATRALGSLTLLDLETRQP